MDVSPLARVYAGLERLVYRGDLQRARCAHLEGLSEPNRVLIIGEGDGRFLRAFVERFCDCDRIDVVEPSARMCGVARARIGERAEVRFYECALAAFEEAGKYDLIVTHFFFDCFDAAGQRGAVAAVRRLIADNGVLLLADFRPTQEWILEAGDMLYVPPRIAHRGTAVGDDCMTYSIGFRAPSRAELIGNWAEDLAARLPDQDRYGDPGLTQQDNPGEISAEAIVQLHRMVTEQVLDPASFRQWFGRYSTIPKNPDIDWRPETPVQADDIAHNVEQGEGLVRNPASRFSFIRDTPSSLLLFVDGECFACSGEEAVFAERICAKSRLAVGPDASPSTLELIAGLFNQGSLAFDLGN